ncbi:neuronal PAS domain-containing protein 2-like [Oppia nitens]|uniref:neuronal PAS domain-containing protein 2-like n=1 Tax=Oppia nitens TaxID=1686743 RepID=UPI0023DCAC5E|nr:neuronal PAS domain-containing protein 2-like [Oppia nitens]
MTPNIYANDLMETTNNNLDDMDNEEKDKNKRINRNLSEKKRRDQFNLLIHELSTAIGYNNSLPADSSGRLSDLSVGGGGGKHKTDKSSILRASIGFLRTNSQIDSNCPKNNDINGSHHQRSAGGQRSGGQQSTTNYDTSGGGGVSGGESIFCWKPSFLVNDEFIHLMLEALDSFLIVLEANTSGRIIYMSDTIYSLLGMISTKESRKQTSVLSAADNGVDNDDDNNTQLSIFDLIHEEEKCYVEDFLHYRSVVDNIGGDCDGGTGAAFSSILLHFKDRDFDDSDETEIYRLVRLVGSFYESGQLNTKLLRCRPGNQYFVGIGRLQTPKFLKELSYQLTADMGSGGSGDGGGREFISRNSLEWKFLYLDSRAPPIIGYLPFEILGTSGYDYYHWNDLDDIVAGHEQLMRTGEATSSVYRFLTKSQQWIWLRTTYYIAYHHWNSKPEYIVCRHTVVRESEVAEARAQKAHKYATDKCRQAETIQRLAAAAKNIDNGLNGGNGGQPLPQQTSASMATTKNWLNCYPDVVISAQEFLGPNDMTGGLVMNQQQSMIVGGVGGNHTVVSDRQSSSVASHHHMMLNTSSMATIDDPESAATAAAVVDNKQQSLLRQFLKQKQQLLEHQIRQQQEELRRVDEQLLLVRAVDNQ